MISTYNIAPGAGATRRALLLALAATPLAASCGDRSTMMHPKMKYELTRGADGVLIHFATLGKGAPLVLLHGFSDQIESWVELGYAEALSAMGRRLIMIDQRGHGGTAKPHDVGAYAAHLQAGDVAAVLDAVGVDRADMLGYSMGGWTALNVARFHPERINHLIVGGCHSFGQSMGFAREAVADGMDNWMTAMENATGGISATLQERIRSNDVEALRAATADDRPDISSELAGFDRPALFYCGGDDILREEVARCAETFIDGRYLELAGLNHMTAYIRAELIIPYLIKFLME